MLLLHLTADLFFFSSDNFELTGDDEITLKGFLDLHVMTAEDEEGGEGEIWDILNTMGYNKQLQLDQVTHFSASNCQLSFMGGGGGTLFQECLHVCMYIYGPHGH